jgi:hypothetical protein
MMCGSLVAALMARAIHGVDAPRWPAFATCTSIGSIECTNRGDKKFPDFNVVRELDVSEFARVACGEAVIQIVKESSLKRSSDAM